MFNRMNTSEIIPTSKMSLKMSCLKACGNDIDRASKLYGYVSDGLELPDTDPKPQTGMSRFLDGIDGISGWIEGHEGQIEKIMTYVQLLRQKK